jgi:hypothetical protein
MKRLLLLTILSFGLIWGGIAQAAEHSGVRSMAANYNVDLDTTTSTIYIFPSISGTASRLPPSATLIVTVEDQAGNPAAGVPVTFAAAPDSMLQGMVAISPQRVTTGADGTAQATLRPTSAATTGTGKIIARAGDITEEVWITFQTSPGSPSE